MNVAPGGRIGAYEVVEPLGAGGMGEVYRARDTRLGRDVALKVLPDAVAADPERRGRLEREARLLASLNHPNIATLFGIEESPAGCALVMELVDGDTLADRLALATGSGPGLPLEETLTIARQIAEALEAAHARGIVHRDLKPANIKVRTDGTVKVLDFGLAKALTSASDSGATVTAMPVDAHAVVGTPAYMSPEQARGEGVDQQTDIWSFGVVLNELLTGTSPFARPTTAETLAGVLTVQPDFARLPATTPPSIHRLLRRCLEKDKKRRWQHIGDVRIEIEEALDAPSPEARPENAASRRPVGGRGLRWIAGAGAVAIVALVAATLLTQPPAEPVQPARLSIVPPDNGMFLTPLISGSAVPVGGAISPDGRTVAFTATDSTGKIMLWIRALDSTEPTLLPGTENAALPFWSTDGKSLAFFGPGTLKRVDLADGAVRVVCRLGGRGVGGSWNRDGVIILAAGLQASLVRVDAEGGSPRPLTTLGETQLSHRFPHFLPDGRHYLYYVDDPIGGSGIFVGALEDTASRRLLAADSAAVYATSGHVLFVRQRTLFAQPFDLETRQVSGQPVSLATSVPVEGAAPAFSVSDTGVMTYTGGGAEEQQFAWFDRNGRLLGTVGPPGNYRGVDLSPDGQRVAVHRHDGTGGDIYIFEPRGSTTRVTHDATRDNSSPVFSPDGGRIAFGSLRNGKWGVYQKRSDATEGDELLLESEDPKIPAAWGGTSIVYWLLSPGGNSRLLPLTLDFRAARVAARDSAVPLTSGPSYGSHAQVSRDGKWIAYVSGSPLEVHVRPFPAGEGVWTISTAGGVTPRWGPDGKELFYVTSYDNGTLMSVPVRAAGASFVAGTPTELFRVGMVTPPHSTRINVYHTYAVAPGSQRFLIPRPISSLRGDATPALITVLVNWTALLHR